MMDILIYFFYAVIFLQSDYSYGQSSCSGLYRSTNAFSNQTLTSCVTAIMCSFKDSKIFINWNSSSSYTKYFKVSFFEKYGNNFTNIVVDKDKHFAIVNYQNNADKTYTVEITREVEDRQPWKAFNTSKDCRTTSNIGTTISSENDVTITGNQVPLLAGIGGATALSLILIILFVTLYRRRQYRRLYIENSNNRTTPEIAQTTDNGNPDDIYNHLSHSFTSRSTTHQGGNDDIYDHMANSGLCHHGNQTSDGRSAPDGR